ncbi:sigma-70 family RNA polymerase sigma factor [Candidatus Aquiluna sp. UB-MaderosW2red]|uniref:sigma-70 family RNA polymerase sigma factor n=1 Tax=Candidatus Aquiluna sp. UB-MaderosW2red TaxID=1855377 RepID=UPI000875D0C3|nr:sigma-70 family RNA polymerase sigma factor [Candidatus Aquiluna sp. UB-MaderosW2red]SCX06513.1 RNA polymerase sigma factor, sigma-70 family [Candidatus Aquiluna sp. UB-MaderosW2red]
MAETPNQKDPTHEDPLEALLDEVSDEEFGLPRFRDHFADSLTPAVLKDWSAKDFASIYVRFRPHLERHAKRFLVNPSQVEEVVQDAFLYLMTTLPELDSELGVLKFLKWKTRLLALDVIRINSKVSMAPLDEQPDIEADMPEISQELERAEDAAIVSLALAKLQPRHREALIATMYEEKSSELVAAQMGLSDNAFRQLLFRARSSFKKALIGEAETAGLSMAEILSIAARKARAESGKFISAAGAFLLVLAISIGVLPNLSGAVTDDQIALSEPTIASAEATSPNDAGIASSDQAPGDLLQPQATGQGSQAQRTDSVDEFAIADSQQAESEFALVSSDIVTAIPTAIPEPRQSPIVAVDLERVMMEGFFNDALDSDAVGILSRDSVGRVLSSSSGSQGNLTITNNSGLTANLSYDLATADGIQYTWFTIELGGNEFVAVPRVDLAQKEVFADGSVKIRYIATDLLIGDVTGNYNFIASDETAVSLGALRLEVDLDPEGRVLASSLSLTKKT